MEGIGARSQGLLGTLGVLAALLLLWEAAVRLLGTPPIILPPPSAIAAELADAPLYYLRHAGYTLGTTLAGFALSVVLGVALAVAIVSSRLAERLIYTVLVVMNSLPKVALAPLFVIWMGTGAEPKIAIAVMLAVFSIVADVALGLRSVDPDALALLPRHEEMLRRARAHLGAALDLVRPRCGERSLRDSELIAASMRSALDALGSLAGAVTPDDVLGRIFAGFCIGK